MPNNIIMADKPSSGGTDLLFTTGGIMYTENIVFPDDVNLTAIYGTGFTRLKSISGLAKTTTASPGNQFKGTPNLETVNLPRGQYFYSQAFAICYKLQNVELGSIGYPVKIVRDSAFQYDTQRFTITMYVDAESLAEAMADSGVGANAPWGATNATIIFKSSVTGEVLV